MPDAAPGLTQNLLGAVPAAGTSSAPPVHDTVHTTGTALTRVDSGGRHAVFQLLTRNGSKERFKEFGIEHRAVSAAFLVAFTETKVSQDKKLVAAAASRAEKYYSTQIEQTTTELAEAEAAAGVGSGKKRGLLGLKLGRRATAPSAAGATLQQQPGAQLQAEAAMAALEKKLKLLLFDQAARKAGGEYMTTRDVHSDIIKAETDTLMIRYMELPEWVDGACEHGQPFLGTAQLFVSHSWDSPWQAVVDAVCTHSDATPPGANKPYYWIDIFAINQHWPKPGCQQNQLALPCPGCCAIQTDLPVWEQMQASHDVGFERVIRTTGKTLLVMEPWFSPRPPTRVWCLYESYITLVQPGGELVVGLGRQEKLSLRQALQHKFGVISRTIRSLDARQANVTVESDRTNIFGAIEQLSGGFDGLNRDLRKSLARWLADNSTELLERQDPHKSAFSEEELQLERQNDSEYGVRLTRVLDRFPAIPFLLSLVGVSLACYGLLFFSISGYDVVEHRGNLDSVLGSDSAVSHQVMGFLLSGLFVCGFASYLNAHQKEKQLRQSTLISNIGGRLSHCLDLGHGFTINYGFALSLMLVISIFGVFGFGFGSAGFLAAAVLLGILNEPATMALYQGRLMSKVGWLYFEVGDFEHALEFFTKAEIKLRIAVGRGHGTMALCQVEISCGKIHTLHRLGEYTEASALADYALKIIEEEAGGWRYWLESCCSTSGWCPTLWMARGTEPFGRLDRPTWGVARAMILAADDHINNDNDEEVLRLLLSAMDDGYLIHDELSDDNVDNNAGIFFDADDEHSLITVSTVFGALIGRVRSPAPALAHTQPSIYTSADADAQGKKKQLAKLLAAVEERFAQNNTVGKARRKLKYRINAIVFAVVTIAAISWCLQHFGIKFPDQGPRSCLNWTEVTNTYCGVKTGTCTDAIRSAGMCSDGHPTYVDLGESERACGVLAGSCVAVADGGCTGGPYSLCHTIQSSQQSSCVCVPHREY